VFSKRDLFLIVNLRGRFKCSSSVVKRPTLNGLVELGASFSGALTRLMLDNSAVLLTEI